MDVSLRAYATIFCLSIKQSISQSKIRPTTSDRAGLAIQKSRNFAKSQNKETEMYAKSAMRTSESRDTVSRSRRKSFKLGIWRRRMHTTFPGTWYSVIDSIGRE